MSNTNSNQSTDFRNIEIKDAIKEDFPAKVYNEYRVHFTSEAYEEMKEHANLTSEVELGGVLIGDVCLDKQGNFLKVCGTISGEHANNYGAQVTFTHETWQHINEIKDKKYPDKRIVGWYHTHPGFGVFLSEMDKFIQDNFFNLPYQIAVVLETKQKVEGCFIWQDGESTPIQRYWVGDEEIKLFAGEVHSFHMEDLPGQQHTKDYKRDKDYEGEDLPYRTPKLLIIMFMVLLFLCGFMMGQYRMVNELKGSLIEMVQSEIYSILEFATLNTSASQDFTMIQQQLKIIKQNSGKKEFTEAEIDKLDNTINNLKTTYDKHRTRFRKDLLELQNVKANLSQKVSQNRLASEELKVQISLLAIMRIKDVLDKTNGDFQILSPKDKAFVAQSLAMALSNNPGSKNIIESLYPGLIKQILPSTQGTNNVFQQSPGSYKY